MTDPWRNIPDGYYAVPDPHDPDRTTLWRVVDDHAEPTPAAARYGPALLGRDVPAGLDKAERRKWINEWFDTVRYPWQRAVRAAILADPAAAGALYAEVAVRCRDCGTPLRDAASKAAGRGPVCRTRVRHEA